MRVLVTDTLFSQFTIQLLLYTFKNSENSLILAMMVWMLEMLNNFAPLLQNYVIVVFLLCLVLRRRRDVLHTEKISLRKVYCNEMNVIGMTIKGKKK